ncbi:hypothetical protein SAMN05192558_101524 [Actinokineospora alba]|uniref:Histidine kinase-like ATPase domain-containing protein n=1 Tax=Actinokineospora alba TaxID=504798 RepID=A0A1H0FUL4_9PSEU|nr:hypothetical protein [Actinokineospora alba]TDP69626.1 hypothetical protein C8E96_5219 [Actinokineospora alba]SDI12653.1 hypothetical protein SAMN05421871_103347 [Actinokineospora alba]SDN98368.1 hypothetical protein SAMN05192558_101524 [Actinokineospora alba]
MARFAWGGCVSGEAGGEDDRVDWLDGLLDQWDPADRLRAMVVAEELIVNAHQHGTPPVVLRVVLVGPHDSSMLITAEDQDARNYGEWQRGAGLLTVGALADRWGVDWRHDRKTVWAELHYPDEADDTIATPRSTDND